MEDEFSLSTIMNTIAKMKNGEAVTLTVLEHVKDMKILFLKIIIIIIKL